MKSLELLRKLKNNQYYTLTKEEEERLAAADSPKAKKRSLKYDEPQVKTREATRGSAAVKETGRLNKHETDPVTE